MVGKQTFDVGGGKPVKGFVDIKEDLEIYLEPHREPVERDQDRGDVVPFSGARQESRCGFGPVAGGTGKIG